MRYLATGRVTPERAQVTFGPVHWRSGESGKVVAQADHGQLFVLLENLSIDGWASARIAAENFAHIAVSSLGFALGSAYGVEIVQVFEDNGTQHVISVRAEQLRYKRHLVPFNRAIQLASADIFFRLALRDYVRAIDDATDCATYCYRAIEAIQASFALKSSTNDGWSAMHAALGTTRSRIERTVKHYADPVRHGNWASAPTTTIRTRLAMLKLTRQVLAKYLEHVAPKA